MSVFLSLSVWLKVVLLSSLLIVCFEGCDRRVLECVVLLFSHFSLSVSSSLTLAVCLCVCVCSFSGPLLWHKKKYWAAPFFVLLPVGN